MLTLLTKTTQDTSRIKIYAELGRRHLNTRPDSAEYYHRHAYDLAEKNGNLLKRISMHRALAWDLYLNGKLDESLKMQQKGVELADGILNAPESKDHPPKKIVDLKASLLSNMAVIYSNNGDHAKATSNYTTALMMFKKINDTLGMASSVFGLGNMHYRFGEYDKANECYQQTLDFCQVPSRLSEKAAAYMGIANVFIRRGIYPEALQNYLKVYEIKKSLNSKLDEAKVLTNIGVVYHEIHEDEKAMEYYQKALQISEEAHSPESTGSVYVNLGILYGRKGDNNRSMDCYRKGLEAFKITGDKNAMANTLGNIGALFYRFDRIDSAIHYMKNSIRIYREINDAQGLSIGISSLGRMYIIKKDLSKARTCLTEGLELAKKMGSVTAIANSYGHFAALDSASGDFRSAFQHLKLNQKYADSLNGEETIRKTHEEQMRFDYYKKQSADSVAHVKENEINDARIKKQEAELKAKRHQQIALYGGILLTLIFAGFMFSRFKVTQKQSLIIQQKEKETQSQKHIIEEKHKEITDSINYAERILKSFLLADRIFASSFNEYFIFFKPKAVVSGDFYWASMLSGGRLACLTADSTGHGVPGAIMSIINISSVEKAIETETEAGEILNKTRQAIIDRLKNDGSAEGGKDGMDCSLFVLHPSSNNIVKWSRLTYAAANSPIWILRENATAYKKEFEIIELPYDKMPVSKHQKDHVPFKQNTFELQKNDVVYTLTDGLADQFGGERGKKFMYKRLKELLLASADKPLSTQKNMIDAKFEEWKGSLEQVDDITLIGVRI